MRPLRAKISNQQSKAIDMAQPYHFSAGSAEPKNGIPLDILCEILQELEKIGAGANAVFGPQTLALVQDGLGAQGPDISLLTAHGLFVAIPPGGKCHIRRQGSRSLYLASSIDGRFSCSENEKDFAGDLARYEKDEASLAGSCARWLRSGDRGASSEALCGLFFGAGPGGREHPRDPADFIRCVEFLEATGTAGRLPEAAKLSPEWDRIVQAWPEIAQTLCEELQSPGGKAPQTLRLLQQAAAGPRPTGAPR